MRHRKQIRRWAAAAAIVAAVGGGAVVGCKKDDGVGGVANPTASSKPVSTAAAALKAYIDALAAGDIATAKSLTATAEMRKLQGTDVDAVFRQRSEEQKRSPWTIAPAPAEGSERSSFVVAFRDAGKDKAALVHVVNEGGAWRVEQIERQ